MWIEIEVFDDYEIDSSIVKNVISFNLSFSAIVIFMNFIVLTAYDYNAYWNRQKYNDVRT